MYSMWTRVFVHNPESLVSQVYVFHWNAHNCYWIFSWTRIFSIGSFPVNKVYQKFPCVKVWRVIYSFLYVSSEVMQFLLIKIYFVLHVVGCFHQVSITHFYKCYMCWLFAFVHNPVTAAILAYDRPVSNSFIYVYAAWFGLFLHMHSNLTILCKPGKNQGLMWDSNSQLSGFESHLNYFPGLHTIVRFDYLKSFSLNS